MNIGDFINRAQNAMAGAGWDQPLSEAQYLTSQVLGVDRATLIASDKRELDEGQRRRLQEALQRRVSGEPLAYIVGFKDFYRYRFAVGPGVLIPRPETEFVVEAALNKEPNFSGIFLDLGTGSGCLAISLLKEWPEARGIAIDASEEALAYTQKNAKILLVQERLRTMHGTVEAMVPKLHDELGGGSIGLIVANPPYIEEGDERVEINVRKFEPHEALYAPGQGLGTIWSWLRASESLLKVGGRAIFEVGIDQPQKIASELANHTERMAIEEIVRDFSGVERVLIFRRHR